jgi:hypothetical protein
MRQALAALLLLLLPACASNPAEAHVVSARAIGIVTQPAVVSGRDGGESRLLWGRSVWVFGDTVLGAPDEEGSTWHHNSLSFTDDLDASDGLTLDIRPDAAGAPAYAVPPTAEEKAFNDAHQGDPCAETPCGARWAVWPTALVFDEPRDRALIFYELIYAEPGDFNFHGVGSGVALWNAFDDPPERPEVSPGTEYPTLLFQGGEPSYGTAAALDGTDLYVYSCKLDRFDFPCLVARVPVDDVLDRTRWHYWDGRAWNPWIGMGRPVFDGSSIVDVSFNAHLGRWTAVYSQPFSNDVILRTAPAPQGPWSDELTLFTSDHRSSDGNTYDALPHPEFAEQDGKVIYVTYSRPTGTSWLGSELPLVRVEFE